MKTYVWILIISSIVSIGAVPQELEIFFGKNQVGNSIILREKIPDLKELNPILALGKSYCVTGNWQFYNNVNFTGNFAPFIGGGGPEYAYEQRVCADYSYFHGYNSVRYLGPADTRTVAISFYEGYMNGVYQGTEVVVEGRAATNLPIAVGRDQFVVSHGASNWTVFRGENFDGVSSCFRSNGDQVHLTTFYNASQVRSVLRDCDTFRGVSQ